MKTVIQRVTKASVSIDGKLVSEIGHGFLVLVGAAKGDTEEQADFLARKISKLRIFEDDDGRMNRSIHDAGGEALVVSQFTLCADTSRGNRPGFDPAMLPGDAEPLVEYFVKKLAEAGVPVKTGVFGAFMNVELANDGPVTIILEKTS
jgi:D-tyrosyl-tRNA(Tyr) deacylase